MKLSFATATTAVWTILFCLELAGHLATAQTPSIAGKWHFVLDTDGGQRIVDPTLQQDGDKVTGKWDKSDVKGTFADGKLDLAFTIDTQEVGPGTLKIKGELANDQLTGTWQFQDYSGSFKATRSAQ